jgi:hypothetical protein
MISPENIKDTMQRIRPESDIIEAVNILRREKVLKP